MFVEEEDQFSRTMAFNKLRKAEKEKDQRWTGKVSLTLGTIAALAAVAAVFYMFSIK